MNVAETVADATAFFEIQVSNRFSLRQAAPVMCDFLHFSIACLVSQQQRFTEIKLGTFRVGFSVPPRQKQTNRYTVPPSSQSGTISSASEHKQNRFTKGRKLGKRISKNEPWSDGFLILRGFSLFVIQQIDDERDKFKTKDGDHGPNECIHKHNAEKNNTKSKRNGSGGVMMVFATTYIESWCIRELS